jgi:type IV pilus assembly protein PilC
MPTYAYKARDSAGKLVQGTMDSVSKEELIRKLRQMGYMTSGIREALPGLKIGSVLDAYKRIKSDDRIIFFVQLSNLINAGVPILGSLDILIRQTENRYLKDTLTQVARAVEAGDGFSESLQRFPKVFSKIFISTIRAGEASGKLDLVLSRLATYEEQQAELRQKVQAALFYPAILLSAGILTMLYIVTFVVPQFAEIFIKAGVHLPGPTQLLYHTGLALKRYWYLLPAAAFAGWFLLRAIGKTESGRLRLDRWKLRLPIFGSLYRKVAVARFSRTLGMLVSAGVPILTSLEIVKDVTSNEVLSRALDRVRSAVERGEKIHESLKLTQQFPLDAVQMIAVGEETGGLDEMLGKIAGFYDLAVAYHIKKMMALLEPLLLCVLGALVGLIMASLLLPIFDMIKVLRAARH